MKKLINIFVVSLYVIVSNTISVRAQNVDEKEREYIAVITKRADKIVATLGLSDSVKYDKVRSIVAAQYRDLNDIHTSRDQAQKVLKSEEKHPDVTKEKLVKLEATTAKKLKKLHGRYLAKLQQELNSAQIEQVKDGMTYRVLPITYKGYQEMLPTLSDEQKKTILAYLTEAREFAMDAETSEKKHAWFGKYKGKINNYLSAAGINMKQASDDWAKRIRKQEELKKQGK